MHKQQKLGNGIRGNCDFHNCYKQLEHCKLKINMTFFVWIRNAIGICIFYLIEEVANSEETIYI